MNEILKYLIYPFHSVTFGEIQSTLCACPNACDETVYRPTVSQSTFPNPGVAAKMMTKGNYNFIKDALTEEML